MPPAAFDLGRPGVVVLLDLREALVAPCQQLIGALRFGQGGQAEHLARIAGQRQPAPRQFRPGQQRRGWGTDRPHAQFGPSARRGVRERVTRRAAGCRATAPT